MASIDSGSDSAQLNGLNEGNFNDVYCDNIEVSSNALVEGNLTVAGSQIYSGTATFANTVQFNGPVYGFTGTGGITYDPTTRTIDVAASSYWSLTGSDLVNQSGTTVNLTRESNASKLVLNFGGSTASRVGIFYNDNSDILADYPLITTSAGASGTSIGTSDELLLGTPNNQTYGGYMSLYPRQLTGSTSARNYVILQKSALSTQNIESNLGISGTVSITGPFSVSGTASIEGPLSVSSGVSLTGSLLINNVDYRSYFSATSTTGFTGFSYNGTGGYSLDVSSLQNQSKWDQTTTTIYPKASLGVMQLLIGTTGSADSSSIAHFKGSTSTSALVESTSSTTGPSIRLKNSSSQESAISTPATLDRLDLKGGIASLLPTNRVGINQTTPSYALEVKHPSDAPVICVNQPSSSSYGGVFFKNNVGVGGVIFQNGSAYSSDGPASSLNIRNDISATATVRVQNQHYFGQSSTLLPVVGDVAQTPTLWGSISVLTPKRIERAYVSISNYFGIGEYNSNVSVPIGNFDGTTSASQLPTPTSALATCPYIIRYTTAGIVDAYWSWNINGNFDIRASCFDEVYNRLYIGGRYSSSGATPGCPNLYSGVASAYTLPSTGGINLYSPFILSFDASNGNPVHLWTAVSNKNNTYDSINGIWTSPTSGRVFACGTVSPTAAIAIQNLTGTNSGYNFAAFAGQCGFALRFRADTGLLTGYWQWILDNSFCWSITTVDTYIYLSGVIYNTAATRTVPNWGGGASARSIDTGTTGNVVLIRFSNAESNTFNDPVVSGLQFINQTATITDIQQSYVAYDSVRNRIVWATQSYNNTPTFCKESLTSTTVYGQTLLRPKNSSNLGVFVSEFNNNATGALYTPVSSLSNYATGAICNIRNIRFDSSGNAYLLGTVGLSSGLTPAWYGPPNGNRSKFNFPFLNEPTTGAVCGFCIVITPSLATSGMMMLQGADCQAMDIVFDPFITTDSYLITRYRNTAASYAPNFEAGQSSYALGTNSTSNCLNTKYTNRVRTSTYHDSAGVGIGRQPSGYAQLEVQSGIKSYTFVEAPEIRAPSWRPPIVADYFGREIGSFCRCFALIDGLSSAFANMRNGINVYSISKISAGQYRIYFSRACEFGDNYAVLVSSTGYLSGNYTIWPFLTTSGATPQTPFWKDASSVQVGLVQTGGAGFDTSDYSVACFW